VLCVRTLLKNWLKGFQSLAVLGAGSVLKADDAAGVRVVEGLEAALGVKARPDVLLCAGETAPENFSGKIRRFSPTHLLVVDAADVGQAPGSIVEIDPKDVGGPTFCSHMLPLRVMIEYLEQETGAKVLLLGIQPRSIAFDGPMSAEVKAAVEAVCGALRGALPACGGDGRP